jgi:hypothetical protein
MVLKIANPHNLRLVMNILITEALKFHELESIYRYCYICFLSSIYQAKNENDVIVLSRNHSILSVILYHFHSPSNNLKLTIAQGILNNNQHISII